MRFAAKCYYLTLTRDSHVFFLCNSVSPQECSIMTFHTVAIRLMSNSFVTFFAYPIIQENVTTHKNAYYCLLRPITSVVKVASPSCKWTALSTLLRKQERTRTPANLNLWYARCKPVDNVHCTLLLCHNSGNCFWRFLQGQIQMARWPWSHRKFINVLSLFICSSLHLQLWRRRTILYRFKD